MGREVRRVPADWSHPKYESWEGRNGFKPLYDGAGYEAMRAEFMERANSKGLQDAIDWYGSAPDVNDYMPAWPEAERTHYMMYEDTTEGTPISPAFETPEQLAQWLTDNGASALGHETASYAAWLRVARGGWAPSAVSVAGGPLVSGVEAAIVDSHRNGQDRETGLGS